jgi:ABC-2 type transport system permease protein
MAELFRRAFADRPRSLIAWTAGLAFYFAIHAAVYPSIRGSADFNKLVQNYPDVLKKMFGRSGAFNFTSGPGYIDAELFSFMLPIFVLAVAIGAGATLIAGDEEHGLLDVWLACPVTRTSLIVSRALVVLAECAVLGAAVVVALLVIDPIGNFDLPRGRVVGAGVALALLGLFHGWLALAVGAATRHRTSAIGVAAAVAAAGYLVGSLYDVASWLRPFRWLSPFFWAGRSPLELGIDVPRLGLLLICTLIAGAAAVLLFDRRDVLGG